MKDDKFSNPCPRCGKQLRFNVSLFIQCDAEFYANLSKKNLRKKGVEVWGASWETANWYCTKGHYIVKAPKRYVLVDND